MKLTVVLLSLFALNAFAAPVSNRCKRLAENEVRYEGEEAYAHTCSVTANRAAIICEVAAYKSGGDASDTYHVVLNKKCSRVLRSELIGEE